LSFWDRVVKLNLINSLMKLEKETQKTTVSRADAHVVHLLDGLIGLPQLKEMEIVYSEEQLPFLWLNELAEDPITFAVVEPGSVIEDYTFEIDDEDANQLGIQTGDDILVLNITTLYAGETPEATINLAAPIVINRRTRIGKQVILEDLDRYPTHYTLCTLVEESVSCAN